MTTPAVAVVVEEYFKVRQSFVLTQLLAAMCCQRDKFPTIKLTNPQIGFSGSTLQLLIILLNELTETGSTEIKLQIRKIMGLRELQDEKYFRKQLLSDLATIGAIQFEYCPNHCRQLKALLVKSNKFDPTY